MGDLIDSSIIEWENIQVLRKFLQYYLFIALDNGWGFFCF